jgi:hypothetical protein
MTDFTSTLAGLGEAFGKLAKTAEEIEQNLSRQFAELESQVAAMRKALAIACGPHAASATAMMAYDAALAGDAGKGWVSPEQHADVLKTMRLRVLNEISARVAELYGKTGGMGINAAQVYVDVLELLAKAAK